MQINEVLSDYSEEKAQGVLNFGMELIEGRGSRGHRADIYAELDWHSIAGTFPVSFDLRERGTSYCRIKTLPIQPTGSCWTPLPNISHMPVIIVCL